MLKFLKSGGTSSGSGTAGKPSSDDSSAGVHGHGHGLSLWGHHHGGHGHHQPHFTPGVEVMRKPPAIGYPRKPSCLSVIRRKKNQYVILVGTGAGTIKIVPYSTTAEQEEEDGLITVSTGTTGSILKILTLPSPAAGTEGSTGVTTDFHVLTTANTLHQFELSSGRLLREIDLGQKLSPISTFALTSSPAELIFLGTEVGNLYKLVKYGADGQGAEINSNNTQNIIYSEILIQNSPLSAKKPGPVEGLEHFTKDSTSYLLIAFQRGLIVLWNASNSTVVRHFYPSSPGTSELEYLHLTLNSPSPLDYFYTSYSDGSYLKWTLSTSPAEVPTTPTSSSTPYGPYPTMRIPKVQAIGNNFTAFSGGLPKSEYGDRYSVSLLSGDENNKNNHITFDLTAKVIDFQLSEDHLFIATEEELVITLTNTNAATAVTGLPPPPSLNCLHPSAVTCLSYGSTGTNPTTTNILLTGHEDGSVRLYDAIKFELLPNGVIHTRELFEETRSFGDADAGNNLDEDDPDPWPPFRKIGAFDPYSDDHRLSIKKLGIIQDYLLIGGTAGQVISIPWTNKTTSTDAEKNKASSEVPKINLSPKEFVWKGHEQLTPALKEKGKELGDTKMVQLSPPGGITCLYGVQVNSEKKAMILVSIASAHGYAVWNQTTHEIIFAKSTLVLELNPDSGNEFSRRKSLKKSLRESFRRLRKTRGPGNAGPSTAAAAGQMVKERAIDEAVAGNKTELAGLVRLMEWTRGGILSVSSPSTPMLLVGLHSGLLQILTLHDHTTLKLSKEIQLKHGSPIVGAYVIDGLGRPIGFNNPEPNNTFPPPLPHRLLLLSEEQIKYFTLPTLRPWGSKLKITAHEGVRMKKSLATPGNLRILLNNGAVRGIRGVLNMDLKRGAAGDFKGVVGEGDLSALTSFIFTPFKNMNSYYMASSSEIQCIEWVWEELQQQQNSNISAGGAQSEQAVPSTTTGKSGVGSKLKRTSSGAGADHGTGTVLTTVVEEPSGPASPDTTIDEVRDHTVTVTVGSAATNGSSPGASVVTQNHHTTSSSSITNSRDQENTTTISSSSIVTATTTTTNTNNSSSSGNTTVIETLIN